MNRFQTITEKHQGHTVYVLRDLQEGSQARIVPSLGANCLELLLTPSGGGKPVAVIDDMKYLSESITQPSVYGIPILFPWPSGIPEGRFAFQGKTIELNPPGIKKATHHGFVNTALWRVVRSDCDNTSAWLTCAIRSDECGEKAQRFPFSFEMEITWRLTSDNFAMQISAENTGQSSMPMGLGLHPYFTIPFGSIGSRAECRLHTAVERQWDLDQITEIDPGETPPQDPFLPVMAFDPVPGEGTPLEAVKFNHVYDARFVKGQTVSSVVDPANKLRLDVTADKDFATWVIYTPPDRSAISLEPWTLVPNGFNLAAADMSNSGMITLSPGQQWQGHVGFQLRSRFPANQADGPQ